jgi:16S rRNA processing protein RimM
LNQKYLRVGKIINTQGLKGELKIDAYTDFPDERFAINNTLYVGSNENAMMKQLVVADFWLHKQFYVLKFKDYNDINDVLPFLNQYLWITPEQQHQLEENAFYFHQIIGLNVKSVDGEMIGTVTDILDTGANDVWVIKREGQPDLLIPYIEDVVIKVDLNQQLITIKPLAGLLE